MKSPMVTFQPYIDRKDQYSDLRVMQSGGGWYVGTIFTNGPEDEFPGLVEPGSRDSGYFATKAEAEAFLAFLETMSLDEAQFHVRLEP